jgi:hypothetical protein
VFGEREGVLERGLVGAVLTQSIPRSWCSACVLWLANCLGAHCCAFSGVRYWEVFTAAAGAVLIIDVEMNVRKCK